MRKPYWIRKTHLFRVDEYVCSVCGAVCSKPHNACPSCGTRHSKTKYDPTWVAEAEIISAVMDEDW